MSKIYEDCVLCDGNGFTPIKWENGLCFVANREEKCQLCATRSRLERECKSRESAEEEMGRLKHELEKAFAEIEHQKNYSVIAVQAVEKKMALSKRISEHWRSKAAVSECEKLDEKRRADKAEAELSAVVAERDSLKRLLFATVPILDVDEMDKATKEKKASS